MNDYNQNQPVNNIQANNYYEVPAQHQQPFQPELTPRQEKIAENNTVKLVAKIIITIFCVGLSIASLPIILLAVVCGTVGGAIPLVLMFIVGFLILIIAVSFIMIKMWKK